MNDYTVRHLARIGLSEATRLYGMTPRAIRFYEERGLVEARRDRLNMRFYDYEARERLAWIASLRRAAISLPDIRYVLEAREDARSSRASDVLGRRRQALVAELHRLDVVATGLNPQNSERLVAASPRGRDDALSRAHCSSEAAR